MDNAVSVIIGTRNRAISLHEALQSLMGQAGNVCFEVVVVDNASTDDTRVVIDRFRDAPHPVRYHLENRSGVAFARNAGAERAAGELLAFMDDDQIADPHWVATIHRSLTENPSLDFVGGRNVAPATVRLPQWVTPELFGPLALGPEGDTPRPIDREHWMTLMGGNMGCRREVFTAVGGFRPYTRSQDRELTLRLLLAGYAGRYDPGMIMYHMVDTERLTRSHFRRWNDVEGAMRAHYQFLERFDRAGRLLTAPAPGRRFRGVPLFVYRECLVEIGRWVRALTAWRRADAFRHELKARQTFSYIVGVARGARELVE